MARRRVIVGVGEALLAEEGDRETPAGLGLLVPIYAALLGHDGIAVSRLGQDPPASVLLSRLRELGVDVTHLQSDPDLATGRVRFNALGGRKLLDAQAAFDCLQWDFDLADVAQRADAVVFGGLTRRSSQARSATDRFLAECRQALRVYDLTGRGDLGLDRNEALTGLRHADIAVFDDFAVRQVLPGAAGNPTRETVLDVLRLGDLSLVLLAQEGRPLEAHGAGSWHRGQQLHERRGHEAALVGFLHGVLAGWDSPASIALAERLARHAREHPDQPPPPDSTRPQPP